MAEWGRDVATRFFAGHQSDGNFMLRRFADGMEALIATEMPLHQRR
ncbi:hypothetical protein [Alloprevotella tannerae]|uniref:Uncharacterized protein n=1 Tax=Alloprevotella tannerae ATCC 51259 TaxID=626522 RepID=C9LEZ2_9BACT|nr:hypothetical protein [Alloprevotella tannerae]EEX72311.1 hypothetical protein GCWU000325_00773 [Alloprevotella tannerae ATCC 51259]